MAPAARKRSFMATDAAMADNRLAIRGIVLTRGAASTDDKVGGNQQKVLMRSMGLAPLDEDVPVGLVRYFEGDPSSP